MSRIASRSGRCSERRAGRRRASSRRSLCPDRRRRRASEYRRGPGGSGPACCGGCTGFDRLRRAEPFSWLPRGRTGSAFAASWPGRTRLCPSAGQGRAVGASGLCESVGLPRKIGAERAARARKTSERCVLGTCDAVEAPGQPIQRLLRAPRPQVRRRQHVYILQLEPEAVMAVQAVQLPRAGPWRRRACPGRRRGRRVRGANSRAPVTGRRRPDRRCVPPGRSARRA